jgi:hydroxyacylglutathione hydrolase
VIQIETVHVNNGPLCTNCYIVTCGDECFVVDPGANAERILKQLGHRKPKFIFVTHRHYDHLSALPQIAAEFPEAPIYAFEYDADAFEDPIANGSFRHNRPVKAPMPDRRLIDNDTIEIGGEVWHVLHTPGHSIGSCCLYCEGVDGAEGTEGMLISGDTLFYHAHGRTDFETGNAKQMEESLTRLARLPRSTRVYPGHDRATTIGSEIAYGTINPYDK